MYHFFIIAWRELKRFRSRFTGRSSYVLLAAIALSLLLSAFVFQHGITFDKNIYTVSISPDSPRINDDRFNVIIADIDTGTAQVDSGMADVYIAGDLIYYRNDSRSLYAVEALKQYFKQEDLHRIASEYDLDKAFPLRVEIDRLNITQENIKTPGTLTPVEVQPTSAPVPSPSVGPSVPPVSTPVPETPSIATTASAVPDNTKIESQINSGQSLVGGVLKDKDVIIPSLYSPPLPATQVILSFLYILPVFFICIFFSSSFMEEKTNRKLSILMSTPVTPFDVVIGKMLPYFALSMAIIAVFVAISGGDLLLEMAVYIPVVLFIFAVYLMVAMFYRTFKDQTFFTMAAIAAVSGYLIFPALFSGVSDLSYISPLTLIVMTIKSEAFSLSEYLFSTGPMYLMFLLTVFLSVRVFNEEYLARHHRAFV